MLDLLKLAPSTKMNGDKADSLGMITPYNIVTDMNKLITEHIENHKNNKNIWDFKFLDIACKSGNFLRAIYKWLMNHPDMINKFEKESDRHSHIVQKQIFGVCFRETDMLIANRNTFGTIELNSHIKYIYNWQDKVKLKSLTEIQETLKETLGQMKFDVVVGNPPYNNDIYLDFVTKAHSLIGGGRQPSSESSNGCVCMITPAKWQAKGGKKNEDFRKNIVPYMSEIVYFDKPTDVFPTTSMCGDAISYYCIGIKRRSTININNKTYENWETRYGLDATNIEIVSRIKDSSILESGVVYKTPCKSYFTTKNFGDVEEDVNSKYKMYSSARCIGVTESVFKHKEDMDKYKVYIGHFITNNPVIHIIEPNVAAVRESCLLGFGTLDECESIKSYYQTKLIWYLVYMTNCGNAGPEAFINVPDPGAFDHIFTDEELYKRYNITEDEIKIIESIIKERK